MKEEDIDILMSDKDIKKTKIENVCYDQEDINWLKEHIVQIQNEIHVLRHILTSLVDSNRAIFQKPNKPENEEDIQGIKQIVNKTYELLKDKQTEKESIFNPLYPREIKNQITFRDIQKSSDVPLNSGKLKTVDIIIDNNSTNKNKEDTIGAKKEITESFISKEYDDVKENNKEDGEKHVKKSGLSFPFFK